ncbi:MAG: transposase [Hyphomicrobiales bacterium]|nr:transposase [Hyphomicrobiales bacterium]
MASGIRADYAMVAPSALACFDDDFEACVAHPRLPVTRRRATRTTNLLERLFVEERRRLKIVPNGFGEKPVLKLIFGALIRAAERWRGLRFTEFAPAVYAQPRALPIWTQDSLRGLRPGATSVELSSTGDHKLLLSHSNSNN